MSIKMRALTSFLGVEGLIKRGQTLEVRDNARAKFLERVYFAKREGNETTAPAISYDTQAVRPSSTQVVTPTYETAVKEPEPLPPGGPEEVKTPAPMIQAQAAKEPQQEQAAPAAPIVQQQEQPLEELTVPQLKEKAKGLQIAGYSKMNKGQLMKAIKANENANKK